MRLQPRGPRWLFNSPLERIYIYINIPLTDYRMYLCICMYIYYNAVHNEKVKFNVVPDYHFIYLY